MYLIAIGISIAVAAFFIVAEHNWYNPATIMGALWAIICAMASMRLYGMYEASEFTYYLIALGIGCFGLGCFISRHNKVRITRGKLPRILNKSEDSDFNYKLIRILCVLSVVLLLPDAIENVKLLLSGADLNEIRMDHVESSKNSAGTLSSVTSLIKNYLVKPFVFALLPVFTVDFFFSQKRDKVILVSSLIIIAERILIEGGRFIVLYLLSALLVTFSLARDRIHIKKSHIFGGIILVAVAGFVIYITTLSRGIADVGQSYYSYLCGCVPHLSIRLERMETVDFMSYGFASLNGIFHYIFSVLENIGFSYPDFLEQVREFAYVEDKIPISTRGGGFNAFVGPYFYMYLDGRVPGVAIGMFLYGYFCHNRYKKMRQALNPRNIAFYLLLVQGLVVSMVRMQFYVTYYTIGFFFICLLINKRKVCESSVQPAGVNITENQVKNE